MTNHQLPVAQQDWIVVIEPKVKGQPWPGFYREDKQAAHTTIDGRGRISRLRAR